MDTRKGALPPFARPLKEVNTKVSVQPHFLGHPMGHLLVPAIDKMVHAAIEDSKRHSTRLLAVQFETGFFDEDDLAEPVDIMHLQISGSRSDAVQMVVRLSKVESSIASGLDPEARRAFNERFRLRVTPK